MNRHAQDGYEPGQSRGDYHAGPNATFQEIHHPLAQIHGSVNLGES
jgi:hypothetical protein